jgi:uncharacterized protein (DUF983 family)
MPDIAPSAWEPTRQVSESAHPAPPLKTALWRGLNNRCPICGEGKVFKGFLRVVDRCENCEAPLGTLRADDAPPYFTIFIAGHVFIPPVLMIERYYEPPIWIQMVVWVPLFALATTLLLRPVKGATVGLMCRFGFNQPRS